jgi:hypothetical protein
MLHYHGLPLSPRAKLYDLAGRCFCVSYAEPRDLQVAHEIGQSVMLDNGAFSFWTKNRAVDWTGFVEWTRPWLDYPTTWAIAPDVIDGTAEDNDQLLAWLYAAARDVWKRSAPVWHMHEPIDRLKRLASAYPRVCVGSSGSYRKPGTSQWTYRMDEAFNAICPTGTVATWVHMLRAMEEANCGDWPFASADSTNVARNHAGNNQGRRPRSPRLMADEIDARQTPPRWTIRNSTMELTS